MYERSRSEGFGAEVKRRILLGTYVLSAGYYDAYYRKAQRIRTLLRRDFDAAFDACDVLLTPTTPETAFRLGEKLADPLTMYLSDVYTVSANLAGCRACRYPAASRRAAGGAPAPGAAARGGAAPAGGRRLPARTDFHRAPRSRRERKPRSATRP